MAQKLVVIWFFGVIFSYLSEGMQKVLVSRVRVAAQTTIDATESVSSLNEVSPLIPVLPRSTFCKSVHPRH
jgi:hypothetical protein